jgi:mono/diheme cytochrome c family protein
MKITRPWKATILVLGLVLAGSLTSAAVEDQSPAPGQAVFKSSCSLCHGADGAGHTPTGKALQIPDLRSAEARKLTDEQMIDVISKGKNQRMPEFGTKLSSEQIQTLVKYIRKFAQDNKAGGGR